MIMSNGSKFIRNPKKTNNILAEPTPGKMPEKIPRNTPKSVNIRPEIIAILPIVKEGNPTPTQ